MAAKSTVYYSHFEASSNDVSTMGVSPVETVRKRLKEWFWEVCSLLLSIACLVAILILLVEYNGHPVPEFFGILTLNTVVSILAGTAKASLILPVAECISQMKWYWSWNPDRPRRALDFDYYDLASRGPWGSFLLLLRARLWHIGTFGALLTVLALAMEPFIQQMPTYPLHSTVFNTNATARISRHFADYDEDLADTGMMNMVGTGSRAAAYAGIWAPGSLTASIETTCSSGSCNWPTYSSLAVCSACANVSDTLTYNATKMTWTLPNGMLLYDSYPFAYGLNGTIEFPEEMSNYSVVDWTLIYRDKEVFHVEERPLAVECLLYFCVKTYNATTNDGKFSETWLSEYPTAGQMPALSSDEKGAIARAGFNPVRPLSGSRPQDLLLRPSESSSGFSVVFNSWYTLRLFLNSLLVAQDDNESTLAGKMSDLSQVLYHIVTTRVRTSADASSPSELFQRLANSLTAHVRNSGNLTAIGETYGTRAVLHVRWAWIAMPSALLVGALVFVGVTFAVNARTNVPSWKSSSLPPLLHGLEPAVDARATQKICVLDDIKHDLRSQKIAMNAYGRRPRMKVSCDKGYERSS